MCRQYANGPVGNESEGGHSMARRVHRFNQNAAQHFFIRSCKESPSPLLGLVAGRGGMDGNGVTSATGASKKRILGTTVSCFAIIVHRIFIHQTSLEVVKMPKNMLIL